MIARVATGSGRSLPSRPLDPGGPTLELMSSVPDRRRVSVIEADIAALARRRSLWFDDGVEWTVDAVYEMTPAGTARAERRWELRVHRAAAPRV